MPYLFFVYLLLLSILALLLYGVDKARAKRGAYRISEKTFLLLGFVGGAAGALVAMRLFRHKTKHARFYVVNVLGLAWQVAVLLWLLVV